MECLTPFSYMSKQAIISFCNDNGRYRENMERLRQSLIGRFDGDFIGFDGEKSVGAPKHEENPYAFKIYCWEKVIAMGYEQILWLDASCFAIDDLTPIFDEIDDSGYIMQEAGHFVGNWCNDFALDWFGITRNEAMGIVMYGNAGFLGLNMATEPGKTFFRVWRESMLAGCFKGSWENHRHDMSCGSIIANQMGLAYKKGDEWLEYAAPGSEPKNETILIMAQG